MHEHDNPSHEGGEQPPTPEQEQRPAPRVYVASLADYNAGRLYGVWISLDCDVGELHERVQSMLGRSAEPIAEEWAIHDYEGFGPLRIDEYEPLERVAALAEGIREHGPAFAHWAALLGTVDEGSLAEFEDVYLGYWGSLEAFAENLFHDYGYQQILDQVIPEHLQPYVRFDAASFANDLVLGGDVSTSDGDGGVYVFGGAG